MDHIWHMKIEPTTVGYIGCAIAVLGFGTQGTFIKSKAITDSGIHHLLVTLLFSACIAFVGFCILVISAICFGSAFWRNDKWMRIWIPGFLLAPGNVLMLFACRRVGVGFAIGIVAATTTVLSFTLGVVALHDQFHGATQLPGVFLLVAATALVSLTKVAAFEDWIDPIPPHLLIEILGEQSKHDLERSSRSQQQPGTSADADRSATVSTAVSSSSSQRPYLARADVEALSAPLPSFRDLDPTYTFSPMAGGGGGRSGGNGGSGAGNGDGGHRQERGLSGSWYYGGSRFHDAGFVNGHGNPDRDDGFSVGGESVGGESVEPDLTRRTDPGPSSGGRLASVDDDPEDGGGGGSGGPSYSGHGGDGVSRGASAIMHELHGSGTLLLSRPGAAQLDRLERKRRQQRFERRQQRRQQRRQALLRRKPSDVLTRDPRGLPLLQPAPFPGAQVHSGGFGSSVGGSGSGGEDDAEDGPFSDIDGLSVAACLGAGLCLAAQGALWSRYAQPRSLATDAGVFFVAQFVATVLLVLPVIVARPAILTAHLEGDDEAGQLVAANSGDAFAVASLGDGGPTSRRSWVVLALPYALAGALCYCIGLGGQVVGLLALPESVAMPLTQLNVIVAGLWGIAYYREIESPRLIYVFVGAVLLDVVGAALLGIELSQI